MTELLDTVAKREAWDAKLEQEELEDAPPYDYPPYSNFPRDIATVQEGLQKLSQAECLVTMDELMSRRPHNKTDLRWQIALWRRERVSWNDARDKRQNKRDNEDVE